MDFVALDIERQWRKAPGWFRGLPREDKASLMAYRAICVEVGTWGR